jgi:hypothetical protein
MGGVPPGLLATSALWKRIMQETRSYRFGSAYALGEHAKW